MGSARKEKAMTRDPSYSASVSAWERAHREIEAAIGGNEIVIEVPVWTYAAASLSLFGALGYMTYYFFWPL